MNLHPSAVGVAFYKPICPHGHDKRIVGIAKNNGQCRECKRVAKRKAEKAHTPYVFINPVCKNGHNKLEVGARKNGACAECQRLANERWRHKKAMEDARPKPAHVPHLRVVRQGLGLSMRDFANSSGISYAMVQKIETGVNRATPKNLTRILGVVAPRLSERKYEEAGL